MSRLKSTGAVAAVSALALLAACTPTNSDPDATRKDSATTEASPAPTFRVGAVDDTGTTEGTAAEATGSPSATADPSQAPTGETVASGSSVDVKAGKRISLSVEGATLKDVTITDTDYPRISADPGTFFDDAGTVIEAEDPADDARVPAPDGSASWVSEFDLVASSTYEVTATATTPDGKDHDFTASATVDDSVGDPMAVRTVLSDDQTVGVAAPIILSFGSTVAKQYRDDVEHRLSVDVTDMDGKKREVEGSWAWLPDDPQSRLHFRPKEYWPAHSKVSVDAPLKNVPTAKGRVGENDLTLDFEIGREQITEASAKTHRMVVTRDGKEVMDFPTSLGSAKAPSYNGVHVVMSKHSDYTMTSARWGYTTPVKWAVRIHNNGEFVHAAPWSAGVQGSQNVSHGCINLTTKRAKEYYDSAIYGDPVIVKDSSVDLSTEDSDISDWVYDWEDWKKMSALS